MKVIDKTHYKILKDLNNPIYQRNIAQIKTIIKNRKYLIDICLKI